MSFAGKEREVATFIMATVGRLIKPTPTVNLTPPRNSSSGGNAGWLSRHSSRPPLHTSKPREPYVDLGPLELSRRH
jgi:hypothetical protein